MPTAISDAIGKTIQNVTEQTIYARQINDRDETVSINRVTIEFTDGTTVTIDGSCEDYDTSTVTDTPPWEQ